MKIINPPYKCIFCNNTDKGDFTSVEHIIPESMGNDLAIIGKGWICNKCNNTFSEFEQIVQEKTILGIERCINGNVSKKGKPTKASSYYINWIANPKNPGRVTLDLSNKRAPVFLKDDEISVILPVVDKNRKYIAKFMLKVGLEILILNQYYTIGTKDDILSRAINYILNKTEEDWHYYTILRTTKEFDSTLKSVFYKDENQRRHVTNLGFDFFLYKIQGENVFFLRCISFFALISLEKPNGNLDKYLEEKNIVYAFC